MAKTWIVVADQREALFYEAEGMNHLDPSDPDAVAQAGRHGWPLALKIDNPNAQPDRELETDRPGRAFSSATGQRHGIDGERSTQRRQQESFAKQVAQELARTHEAGKFDRVVLAAAPRMLGLIRAALPDSVRAAVMAEVAKDLVRFEGRELLDHLPADARPKPTLRA